MVVCPRRSEAVYRGHVQERTGHTSLYRLSASDEDKVPKQTQEKSKEEEGRPNGMRQPSANDLATLTTRANSH